MTYFLRSHESTIFGYIGRTYATPLHRAWLLMYKIYIIIPFHGLPFLPWKFMDIYMAFFQDFVFIVDIICKTMSLMFSFVLILQCTVQQELALLYLCAWKRFLTLHIEVEHTVTAIVQQHQSNTKIARTIRFVNKQRKL